MTIPPPNFPPPEGDPPTPPPPDRSGCFPGGLVAVLYCAVVVAVALTSRAPAQVIVGGAIGGVVLGTAAIASDKLRPYAAGFLGGLAAVVIVLGGACVALIAMLTSGPS